MIFGIIFDIIVLIDLDKNDVVYLNLIGLFIGYDFLKEEMFLNFFYKIIYLSDFYIVYIDFVVKMCEVVDDDIIEVEYCF